MDFEEIRESLTKFVRGYVRDRHAAEDLVQEAMLRALRSLSRYRGKAALKTWVFTIARNLCIDYLRSPARSRLRRLESFEVLERPTAGDPGEEADGAERRARVTEALGRLPSNARKLLVLRVYQGLSYREIARLRGEAPAGIGTRISRALQGLSRRLAQA